LPALKQLALTREWLLDLYDQLGAVEHVSGAVEKLATGLLIGRVSESGSGASAFLDQNAMAAPDKFGCRRRDDAHAVFVVLGLCGDPDDHAGLRFKLEDML
jgi:hypothetical protein